MKPGQIQKRYKLFPMGIALLVACITFVIYLPALQNGFVGYWDDKTLVSTQNIKSLDLQFWWWAINDVSTGLWYPMLWLSLAIDYAIWALNPMGYHFTNIILHTVNTFLIFILILQLLRHANYTKDNLSKKAITVGTVTSLLFGIHPLHVESVAWVSERKDVLYAFFFLSSILAYLRYVSLSSRKFNYYIFCLIFFILALMSKPMAISLPIVLLILDFYPLKRLTARNMKPVLIEKLPFILLSLMLSVITVWGHPLKGGLQTLEIYTLSTRITLAIHAYVFYMTKILLPFNLAPLYPPPLRIDSFTFEYIWPFAAITVITVSSIQLIKRNRVFLATWLYYIVTLAPVIGVLQTGVQVVADRYTYLPSLGLFLLIGLGVSSAFERCSKRTIQISTIVALSFVLFILGVKTVKQIAIWHDPITLWFYEIKLFPNSYIAHNNRGAAYRDEGWLLEAKEEFQTAIKLNPSYAPSHNNLGAIYYLQGEFDAAIQEFKTAIRLNPNYDKARYNLGKVYLKKGLTDEARIEFEEASKLQPSLPAQKDETISP